MELNIVAVVCSIGANVWVFLLAPLVGGVLAALVYMFLDPAKKEEK